MPLALPIRGSPAALAPAVERLAGLIGDVREDLLAPQGLSVWRAPSAPCSPTKPGSPSATGSTASNPRFAFSVARALLTGSMIPESERNWANLMRQEARGRLAYLLHPARSSACRQHRSQPPSRPEALGARSVARSHHLSVCAWRIDRCAASQPPAGDGGRVAHRPVNPRASRQRRDPGRGGPRFWRTTPREATA